MINQCGDNKKKERISFIFILKKDSQKKSIATNFNCTFRNLERFPTKVLKDLLKIIQIFIHLEQNIFLKKFKLFKKEPKKK